MKNQTYMGISREKIPWAPKVDIDKCIGCGTCVEVCPNGVFVLNNDLKKAEVVNPDNCVVLCDKCEVFCPADAISFPDKESTKKLIIQLLNEKTEQDKQGL